MSCKHNPKVISSSIFSYINSVTLNGGTSKARNEVHQYILNTTFPSKEGLEFCLLHAVKKLKPLLHHSHFCEYRLLSILRALQAAIRSAKRDIDNEKIQCDNNSPSLLRKLLLDDVAEMLIKYIMMYTVLPHNTAYKYDKKVLKWKGIALELFHDLCIEFDYIARINAENISFIQCLFSYMQNHETCFPACRILECLLLSKKSILDLSTIDNLVEIISRFDDIPLGNFCKILAITLSELDMYEHKTSLYAQTKQKKNHNFYVRDINQDIILKVPNILAKLVGIACAKPFVPSFPSANLESEQWMQWIEEQFNQEISNTQRTCTFIGGITQWAQSASNGRMMTSVQITSELTFRADAVCVLGLLLVGRHRKEVQKDLAELKLIPQLSDVFDHFIWRSNALRDHIRLPGHNFSCECSPEVALKIQVLRLIHSFCDHSDYKHVMLSWSEYSELQSFEASPTTTEAPIWLTPDSMCFGEKGLLSKIVEVMKKESGASTFRFWLSRAIESYLRGSFSGADQDFLLRRNLLKHIVENLINSNIRHKEVLQSSFDLLGELIKFNIKAFRDLNEEMSISSMKRLESVMSINLVDSNMFIRSLILSYELFSSSEDGSEKEFAEKQCYFLSHVSRLKTRVHYLKKLLSLITIQNLTQENVSCLNTALVILMFGFKKGELPEYLQMLASIQNSCSVAITNRAGPLDNLKDLLLFWQDHYLQKDKDCTILERSSRIIFQEWRDAVSLLTSEDPTNPCAITFYTRPSLSPTRAC